MAKLYDIISTSLCLIHALSGRFQKRRRAHRGSPCRLILIYKPFTSFQSLFVLFPLRGGRGKWPAKRLGWTPLSPCTRQGGFRRPPGFGLSLKSVVRQIDRIGLAEVRGDADLPPRLVFGDLAAGIVLGKMNCADAIRISSAPAAPRPRGSARRQSLRRPVTSPQLMACGRSPLPTSLTPLACTSQPCYVISRHVSRSSSS